MTDIIHQLKKTGKHFLFDVQLNWLSQHRGLVSAPYAPGVIAVATPVEFGGEGKDWNAEQLFLASISSCYMSTYLSFANKFGFTISRFECNCIGRVELVDGRYRFTGIDLYPQVYISGEPVREKAELAIHKTQKYCLIANSIDTPITYHTEVLLDQHPKV